MLCCRVGVRAGHVPVFNPPMSGRAKYRRRTYSRRAVVAEHTAAAAEADALDRGTRARVCDLLPLTQLSDADRRTHRVRID